MRLYHPIRLAVIFLALSSGLLSSATAQTIRYVRAGAAGSNNGLDWANAYSSLPSTLLRGATYYVADGNYNGYNFNTAASGTTLITIKKATIAEHGTETGWQSVYGDGVALFGGTVSFSAGYCIFDGAGRTSWTSGHGFKISHLSGEGLNIEAPNVTIRYVETQGNGGDGDGGYPNNDSVSWRSSGNGDNALLQYCYFYNAGRCIFFCNQSVSGVTIEHCYTGLMESTAAEHAETASIWGGANNWTFRYNLITYAEGTGGLILEGNTFLIYGNVFYRATGVNWENGNGVIGTWTVSTLTGCKVYNNTFVNINSGQVFGTLFSALPTGNEVKNNLFYNVTAGMNYSLFPTHNYNHYINSGGTRGEANGTSGTADPFTAFTNLNFSLKTNTAAGENLGSPYNVDPTGKTRSTWTRGAYEFGVVNPSPAISISPTTLSFGSIVTNTSRDLSFTVQNVGSGTLAGAVTVAAPFAIISGANYSLGASQSQSVTVRYSPVVVGNNAATATFTGGNGMTASVTGTAATISANSPPTVSTIGQNAVDVDTTLPGFQIFEGTVVQYSGSASDANGDPLTWQWIYTVNGGAEVVFLSGTGTVTPASFSYGSGTAGRTYVWKLRVTDGVLTSETQLTVGVKAPASVGGNLNLEAESGVLSAPFVIANGVVSQAITTDLAGGGRAVYTFTVTNAGTYVIQAFVNAPSLTQNSFYVNIDAEPQDPAMAWDILPPSTGFENRLVSWRGSGTADANEFVPKIFNLGLGTHQLIVRGREANVELDRFAILRVIMPPQDLRIVPSLQ